MCTALDAADIHKPRNKEDPNNSAATSTAGGAKVLVRTRQPASNSCARCSLPALLPAIQAPQPSLLRVAPPGSAPPGAAVRSS